MIALPEDKRIWIGGGAAVGLVLVAISWLTVINPKLSNASSLRDQAASADTQNVALLSKVNKLKQQNDDIAKLAAGLETALHQLPSGSGLSDLTREISALSAVNNVSVASIAVGGATTATSGATTAGSASSASTAATSTSTGSATAAADTAVISIPVTLISQGSFEDELKFLYALQHTGPRVALVTSSQFATGAGSTTASVRGNAQMTIELAVYSAPMSAPELARVNKIFADIAAG